MNEQKILSVSEKEVEQILKILPELELALMHDGKIVEFFDTARDAFVAGQALFKPDHCFSIQEVIQGPIDLGFYSHAVL